MAGVTTLRNRHRRRLLLKQLWSELLTSGRRVVDARDGRDGAPSLEDAIERFDTAAARVRSESIRGREEITAFERATMDIAHAEAVTAAHRNAYVEAYVHARDASERAHA